MKIEEIARKIFAFNPDTDVYGHVKVGIDVPLKGSATGITWRDIQKLAKIALRAKSK